MIKVLIDSILKTTKTIKNKDFQAINPLTSLGEGVTVFTSPYLSAEAPALVEAKGLMNQMITSGEYNYLIHYFF